MPELRVPMPSSSLLELITTADPRPVPQHMMHYWIWLVPIDVICLFLWVIVISAICRDSYLRTDLNSLLILSIALGDLLLCGMTISSAVINHDRGGYALGFYGCVAESSIISISFCALGLSNVAISLDRYLSFVHGFEKSYKKTLLLLSTAWTIAVASPLIMIITKLPLSVDLIADMVCMPDFASSDPYIRGWLIFCATAIMMAMLTIVFCYTAIYRFYISTPRALRRKNSAGTKQKSHRLLVKFCIITCAFVIYLLPLLSLFVSMLATSQQPSSLFFFLATLVFQSGSLLNPILFYFLDARVKRSVNEMFSIFVWQQESRFQLMHPSAVAAVPETCPTPQYFDSIKLCSVKCPKSTVHIISKEHNSDLTTVKLNEKPC